LASQEQKRKLLHDQAVAFEEKAMKLKSIEDMDDESNEEGTNKSPEANKGRTDMF
jgi:hypothetical protein